MLSTPVVPHFASFGLVLFALMAGLSVIALGVLVRQSRAGFEGVPLSAILARGRLKRQGFYAVLALQFALASGFVLWLDRHEFMPGDVPAGHGGIAAYLGPDKATDEIRLARILACDWSDRFRPSALIAGASADAPALPDTPDAAAFRAFAAAIEANFQFQAPMAVQSLTERLNPVFVVLGGLFLVTARGLVRRGEDDETLPVRSVFEGGLLAFCFVFLAYFAIIGYHASTEVARAFAAGRVVCTSHVAPFFIAQSQALSTSAVCLLVLFLASPRPIFRNL
ncbi:MAG: hypothetical protein EP307_14035 [Rhodobacteraceae bacterium]|nr:MAG: hypothetical protein EP307_14035 [Paracoccaceae bacterium]